MAASVRAGVARVDVAWRGLAVVAASFAVLLAGLANRYGYHRDELSFIAAGGHPAFGYVDQPPLVPLLAHALNDIFDGSLFWLRLPSALAGAITVIVCGLMAREFDDGPAAQLFAATCFAVSSIAMAVGHLLSPTSFDVLVWTLLSWLLIRALKDPGRSWLPLGFVAGLGLEVKTLVVFFVAAVVVGLFVVGPRFPVRSTTFWAAGGVALLLWMPNLIWQASNGWPQLELSRAIANGSSGTSQPWWVFLPFQLLLVSPVLVPVWLAGLWRLWRAPDLSAYRVLAFCYVALAGVFMLTGGKPYYIAGLYPVLLAAGAAPALRWATRGASRLRRGLLAAALATTLMVSTVLFLPVVPAGDLPATPVIAINYDAGETIGWPGFAATMTRVYRGLPASEQATTVFLTGNYGEAGALERFRPELAPVYSGHNSFATWGPPPHTVTTAVVVGYDRSKLDGWFGDVRRAATIRNSADVGNDEAGNSVWVCQRPRASWPALWPQIRHLG